MARGGSRSFFVVSFENCAEQAFIMLTSSDTSILSWVFLNIPCGTFVGRAQWTFVIFSAYKALFALLYQSVLDS